MNSITLCETLIKEYVSNNGITIKEGEVFFHKPYKSSHWALLNIFFICPINASILRCVCFKKPYVYFDDTEGLK